MSPSCAELTVQQLTYKMALTRKVRMTVPQQNGVTADSSAVARDQLLFFGRRRRTSCALSKNSALHLKKEKTVAPPWSRSLRQGGPMNPTPTIAKAAFRRPLHSYEQLT